MCRWGGSWPESLFSMTPFYPDRLTTLQPQTTRPLAHSPTVITASPLTHSLTHSLPPASLPPSCLPLFLTNSLTRLPLTPSSHSSSVGLSPSTRVRRRRRSRRRLQQGDRHQYRHQHLRNGQDGASYEEERLLVSTHQTSPCPAALYTVEDLAVAASPTRARCLTMYLLIA